MPTNAQGIFYADNSTEMSVADITAAMATSIGEQVLKLQQAGIVASAAERDALYPVPVQGNSVFRSDLGRRETYYALYNSTTNPGGRTPAGWEVESRKYVFDPAGGTPPSPRPGDTWEW